MNRRKFLATATAVTGTALLPSWAHTAYAQSTGTYTYLTPFTLSLAFAPILYASAAGLYEKQNLNVKVEVGRGAGQVIQLVAAKQVQSGRTGGANYMAMRAMDNADVIAFATVAQTSPFVVISSSKAPLTQVKELEGKTVGMASFGGSMEATLNLMLAKAGIDLKSVQRERVADGPASFAMIEAGRLHAFFGNTSTISRLKAQNYPLASMPVDDGVPGQVYVAREADLKENRDQHIAFIRGARQAITAMAGMNDAQLTDAIKLMGKKFDVPGIDKLDIALNDLKGNRDLWLVHGVENALKNDPKQWAEGQQLLQQAELMRPTTRALYTNDIWEASLV
ncbi:MAG TPA: ABC transporter substrate-binding protein [Eoetvoesiella sp.]